MPKTTPFSALQSHIQQVIARAVNDAAAAVRQELADEIRRILGGVSATVRRPAAPRASVEAAPVATRGRRRRGSRTGPNEVTLEKVIQLLRTAPNLRSEEIQKRLGLPSEKVKAALTRLRKESRIKTKGERRATTYSAA